MRAASVEGDDSQALRSWGGREGGRDGEYWRRSCLLWKSSKREDEREKGREGGREGGREDVLFLFLRQSDALPPPDGARAWGARGS